MDLRTQLESTTERNWNKEKMELLERFDNERKEWECQWKVMQKKIEELYQEVKLRRESNMNAFENKSVHCKEQLSVLSPTSEWSNTTGLNCCSPDKESLLTKAERKQRTNDIFEKDNLAIGSYKESEESPGLKTTKNYAQDLNIALKELVKVSEDLCSYQEEIRKKSNSKRKKSFPFLGESAETENSVITHQLNHMCNNDSKMSSRAFETEEKNNRKNLMSINGCLKETPSSTLTDLGGKKLPWQKREAPPVPPRSTSRHLTSSLAHISETLVKDTQQDGITLINSPSTRQCDVPIPFKDEWKPVNMSAPVTAVPVEKMDSSAECKLSAGFCHNTWSCDTTNAGNCPKNGSSPHSVQKSCSDGNMVTQKMLSNSQNSVHYASNLYSPVCDTLGDSGYGTGKTQRNETLEAKIDEFNRIVFHTDKGQKHLQQNQMLSVPSGDSKVNSIQQDCKTIRTQNEDSTYGLHTKLSLRKEEKPCKPVKIVKTAGQQKQMNGILSGYRHMLHEHDWRPSNLSGRPRSADSRSNYGVVEKLLKNYEKSTSLWNSQFHQDQWVQSDAEFSEGNCEKLSHCFEMLHAEQGKVDQPKNATRHVGLYTKSCKEKQKFPEVSAPMKQSNGKGFSRPSRPANRRLPSRWASRSPSAPPAVREQL
uniref:KIAA0408 n=1 Tax=Salvator merianae TaxID=96440 RepID=A0A8D0C043_SALMN